MFVHGGACFLFSAFIKWGKGDKRFSSKPFVELWKVCGRGAALRAARCGCRRQPHRRRKPSSLPSFHEKAGVCAKLAGKKKRRGLPLHKSKKFAHFIKVRNPQAMLFVSAFPPSFRGSRFAQGRLRFDNRRKGGGAVAQSRRSSGFFGNKAP